MGRFAIEIYSNLQSTYTRDTLGRVTVYRTGIKSILLVNQLSFGARQNSVKTSSLKWSTQILSSRGSMLPFLNVNSNYFKLIQKDFRFKNSQLQK